MMYIIDEIINIANIAHNKYSKTDVIPDIIQINKKHRVYYAISTPTTKERNLIAESNFYHNREYKTIINSIIQ